MPTDTTEAIVARGESGVPMLATALSSESPVQVGYAAYCLERIGDCKQRVSAEAALHRIQAGEQTAEKRFAIMVLKRYLATCDGG